MDRESFLFFFFFGRAGSNDWPREIMRSEKKKKIQTADVLNIGQLIGVLS